MPLPSPEMMKPKPVVKSDVLLPVPKPCSLKSVDEVSQLRNMSKIKIFTNRSFFHQDNVGFKYSIIMDFRIEIKLTMDINAEKINEIAKDVLSWWTDRSETSLIPHDSTLSFPERVEVSGQEIQVNTFFCPNEQQVQAVRNILEKRGIEITA